MTTTTTAAVPLEIDHTWPRCTLCLGRSYVRRSCRATGGARGEGRSCSAATPLPRQVPPWLGEGLRNIYGMPKLPRRVTAATVVWLMNEIVISVGRIACDNWWSSRNECRYHGAGIVRVMRRAPAQKLGQSSDVGLSRVDFIGD